MTLDMSQQSPEPEEPETEAERRRANMILLGAAIALVILGVWLVNALVDARKSEECFESGRRNCNPVDVDRNAN
jgi:flagellar biogenesis protein FliO